MGRSGRRKAERYNPTNAYALLTGRMVGQPVIQCGVFKGTNRAHFVDRREFEGSIQEQMDGLRAAGVAEEREWKVVPGVEFLFGNSGSSQTGIYAPECFPDNYYYAYGRPYAYA